MSFSRWVFAAAAVFVITAVGVIIWLLTIASHAKPGTDQANARLDAVRTGLAAGAGAGAAVGLVLALRRQHHQEIATTWTDLDATERRITELYTKAVEQLGSDKAPVRLGGLYALERLAQDNPAHRQTIVNVICAYLRMPFLPAAPATKPAPEATEEPAERDTEAGTRTDAIGDTWHQERQVRLTAQQILAEHLRDYRPDDKRSTDPPSPRFWPDIRLDLAGATLIDFKLRNAVIADARFQEATFCGITLFEQATFSRYAGFELATFNGFTSFDGTTFHSSVGFDGAAFSDNVGFVGATFRGETGFERAAFGGQAVFIMAAFDRFAGFSLATFRGEAKFDRATFNETARFDRATFNSASSLSFTGSRVLKHDVLHLWPAGWCVGPNGNGGYTVVRANDDGATLARQLKGGQIGGNNDGGLGGLSSV
jgi:hypothetical protein